MSTFCLNSQRILSLDIEFGVGSSFLALEKCEGHLASMISDEKSAVTGIVSPCYFSLIALKISSLSLISEFKYYQYVLV